MRKPTSEESASLERVASSLAAVDKAYPPPTAPRGVNGSAVVRISDDGVFNLANGDRVLMDGVSCSADGLDALRRVTADKDTKVVIARRAPGDPSPADLWVATAISGLEEPAYSAIAETALTNAWCKPAHSTTNPHQGRYQALAQAFAGQPRR